MPVGGAHDNDIRAVGEAVHLGQHLVQGLISLVVALRAAAGAAHCINLIHKDDRWRQCSCLYRQHHSH